MDLSRLLRPRSVAVVGATERSGSYAGETILNLGAAGYAGEVWGVNPRRSSVYGRPCFPTLSDCPSPPDAVVVAIPAPGVPAVVEEAGATGCGGAVVYGAGFGEIEAGRALQDELEAAALRHGLPLCGPNGNGIVALHERCPLWGDALRPLEPGRVALVSQSGNVAVNALVSSRGLRLHTVVSCGNSVALDPARWVAALARDEGVGSIALYLEGDGDGALLAEALADCTERGVGVAVLKVGASAAGSAAAAAHTGAVAGELRVFRALMEEAGAAWADDVHDLLELAKALAVPGARSESPGLAVLTCSGGDSALAADECERIGLRLPQPSEPTERRLRGLLPEAATVGNPLDYTALIWGEVDTLRDIIAAAAGDPGVGRALVFYDQPRGIEGAAEQSWALVREGIHAGAATSPVPVLVASTLPELLDDDAAARFVAAGVPAVAGLRTALACAAALGRPEGEPARLRAIAAAARSAASRVNGGGAWLSEFEAKELLREAELPVVPGRLVSGEDDAVEALAELGGRVALKLAAPSLRHKTELGAVLLDLREEAGVRSAHRRLLALGTPGASVLVEQMAPAGAELLVSARTDAVVPCLVVGAGGLWTELLSDAAVLPLPTTPERVERAIRGLRSAPLFTGARGRPELDVGAAARLGAAAGQLLLDHRLELLELNPVIVHEQGVSVVDALAARRAG